MLPEGRQKLSGSLGSVPPGTVPIKQVPSALGDLTVWRIDLDLDAASIAMLEQVLSANEIARADRFRSMIDRSRFIAARGALKTILGQRLDIRPERVQFAIVPSGKPYVAGEEALHFNISHSHALALIAVSDGREVGIDVERLRTDFDPKALAKRFFAAAEYEAVCDAPDEERHRLFLIYWTCKEAYLKAIGSGLNVPLRTFSVSPLESRVTILGSDSDGDTLAPYHLQQLEPGTGYVAAIAIQS